MTNADDTTEAVNAEGICRCLYAFEPSFAGAALFAGLAKGAGFE